MGLEWQNQKYLNSLLKQKCMKSEDHLKIQYILKYSKYLNMYVDHELQSSVTIISCYAKDILLL